MKTTKALTAALALFTAFSFASCNSNTSNPANTAVSEETTKESVVTSGDYQRYYTVDGKQYHHIIDPETLYPAAKWKAVSIICDDSGMGDALSTALFLLDLEEGQKLLEKCNACAVWVDLEGETYYSPGFKELIRT